MLKISFNRWPFALRLLTRQGFNSNGPDGFLTPGAKESLTGF